VSPYLEIALAALEDLKEDLHHQSNRAFFSSRFVTAVDFGKQEATVRNCLELLASLNPKHPFTFNIQEPEDLAA